MSDLGLLMIISTDIDIIVNALRKQTAIFALGRFISYKPV